MFTVRYFSSFGQLPKTYAVLVEAGAAHGLFGDPEWFDYVMRRVFDRTDSMRLYGVEDTAGGRPLLLAPLRLSTTDAAVFGARTIGSVSHPENYAAIPLSFDPAAKDRRRILAALFRHLKKHADGEGESPCDVIRLWPLEAESDLTESIYGALRDAGFLVQRYANSFNRYEATEGLSFADYFAARSANLRYSVRRRQRALVKKGSLELALYRGDDDDLGRAIDDYIAVSLASWKDAPTMIAPATLELIDLAARKGCLRLGILRLDGVAAAAQFWIVTGGVAHCARLAYREACKPLAVGVVLTGFMIAQVLDHDRVSRIDFGYGEEDYKGGWMKSARDYYGFMAFNPSTRRGAYHGLRQILGRPVKRAITYWRDLASRAHLTVVSRARR